MTPDELAELHYRENAAGRILGHALAEQSAERRRKAWISLFEEVRYWLTRNWKLLLGILIGYISAGVIIYLDRWLQSLGITR